MSNKGQREEWLERVHKTCIIPHFKAAGYEVPENIKMSTGWPSKGGLGNKTRTLGECWDAKAATDGHFHIFISPVIEDSTRVLDMLIHEVVHAVVGIKAGHKKPFAKCAEAVGLVKPWTKTTASPELLAKLEDWVARIGPYPHGAIKPNALKQETEKGRCLLMECECGCKIRTTKKWLEEYGPEWACMCGGRLISQAA
jgi:hypothetical protein